MPNQSTRPSPLPRYHRSKARAMPPPEQPKKHLYLAFDDWNFGYPIRKVNLRVQSSDPGEDSEQLPVFMRIQAQRGYPRFFTSAFGTKIMALHPRSNGVETGPVRLPAIDVQDHTISFETPPNGQFFPLYIPVSDEKLFALDFGKFKVLPSSLSMWRPVPLPPFPASHVVSYGVHPDGCILVGTEDGITFIFDTKEHVWKLCGNWVFPFTGQGHYDPSLGGFVGLSTEGHLYCCTMASTTTIGDTGRTWFSSPEVKCAKDKVYNKDPTEGDEGQHVSATLVHMCQGKFCLVECVCTDNTTTDEDDPELLPGDDEYDFMGGDDEYDSMGSDDEYDLIGGGPQGGRFMYRVKIFNLSYDTEGDLKLTNCNVHCYSLPHEARIGSIRQNPVAFWL